MLNDPDVMEAWYKANLALVRLRESWLKKKVELEAGKARLQSEQSRETLLKSNKHELAKAFQDRGPKMRSFAAYATKAQLVDQLIADRVASIEAELESLARLLETELPDPRWRPREEGLQ